MAYASVGRVVKHKSMLAEPSCLWTISMEPNTRTFVLCREHEDDAPLSCGSSRVVRLSRALLNVDQHRAKLAKFHHQNPRIARNEVYPSRWYLRNGTW